MTSLRFSPVLAGVLWLAAPSLLGCAEAQPESGPPSSTTTAPSSPPPPPGPITDPTTPPAITPNGPDSIKRTVHEPPAVSGGTLLVMQDGTTAVAADPDRDVVWVVDLTGPSLLRTIPLQTDDEPGRVVEDGAGIVHVLLRRGGAMVAIDPVQGTVLSRTPVCPAPRGLAYDAAPDALYVACADGRLFTFPAAGGSATSVVQVDDDLRDVVVQDGTLYVTQFRSANVLQLASDGTVAQRIQLPQITVPVLPMPTPSGSPPGPPTATATPDVAYRAVPVPGGGIAVLHQRALDLALSTMQGGYQQNMGCPGTGLVSDAVTIVQPGTTTPIAPTLGMTALAVDVAVSADGTQVAVASASPNGGGTTVYATSMLASTSPAPPCALPTGPINTNQEAIAVAFAGNGSVVAQIREPAQILVGSAALALPAASVHEDGHSIFHFVTQAGIACASCHAEGGDDGRVWEFQGLGPRRTMNLRGGVLARAPFHWNGQLPDMESLVQAVLVGRMNGPQLSPAQVEELGMFIDAQPALLPPAPDDPAAVARGQAIFEDASVGCTGCHNGPQMSDHQLFDVGTDETPGELFKVPSLIAVRYRAPYLHNGCAGTLADRFSTACDSGDQHGNIQQLTTDQIDDLVAYLESL